MTEGDRIRLRVAMATTVFDALASHREAFAALSPFDRFQTLLDVLEAATVSVVSDALAHAEDPAFVQRYTAGFVAPSTVLFVRSLEHT